MRLRAKPWTICAVLLGLAAGSEGFANPTSRELVEISDIGSLSVSPDGRHAVFRTERANVQSNSYRLDWYAADLTTGAVRRIADGGLPVYADPGSIQPEKVLWDRASRTIYFRALVDGALGIWSASVAGERSGPVVIGDSDVEDMSLSQDGRAILYKIGPSRAQTLRAEQDEYDEGILVDKSVDLAQNLFRGASINGRMASQRLVGYWYVRAGLLWRAPRQQRRHELLTGEDKPFGQPLPVPPFEPPSQELAASATAVNGDRAEARWDGANGSLIVHLASLPAGAAIRCNEPVCTTGRISALAWRPDSSELLVTFTDRQRRQSLYLWDVHDNRLSRLVASDGLLSGGRRNAIPCAVARSGAVCVAAGPASPPRLVKVDLASGAQTTLFDPNSGMRSAYRPDVEFLSLRGASGTTFGGVLLTQDRTVPRRSPLYINYYNCEGFLRGGEGDEWPVPALLDAGFAVACINVAPFTGAQDAVGTYRTGLEGVRVAVSALTARGLIDPAKVAMGGLSFGSEVAMWTAIHSRLLAAVSISSAQVEAAEYWMSAMPGSDHADFTKKVWGLGAPEQMRSRWRMVSPALNVDRIRAPVLFQLPEQEARRIPELYARLAAFGTPTELYAFPDEAHFKLQPRHRLAVFERNLDWFRYWLQDVRDDSPAKRDQYRRWDLLRQRWRAGKSRPLSSSAAKGPGRPSR